MLRSLSLAVTAAAVLSAASIALAAPSPSPALSGILTPPGSGFVEATSDIPGALEGSFDPQTFVTKLKSTHAAEVQQTLQRYGFEDGYWRMWINQAAGRVLAEMVIAFSGGDGAKRWLSGAQATDKADPSYQHSETLTGITSDYYGARFLYSADQSYSDWFAFVKGNDYFGISVVSTSSDLGTTAADQTTAQYLAAPDNTIPPSQWASLAVTGGASAADFLGSAIGRILIYALIGGVAALIVGLVRRGRRGAAVAPVIQNAGGQMSADGRWWWDGQSWHDAAVEVPPGAQRSGDGRYWWDGTRWRPAP